jgi:hypothetical protein
LDVGNGRLVITGEEVDQVVGFEAQRAMDKIVETFGRSGSGATKLAGVYLAGAAAETPAFVDAARRRFGFDRVAMDADRQEPLKAPRSSPVAVDLMVGRKHLRANEAGIEFGADSIPLNEVDGVAYWRQNNYMNGVQTSTLRVFTVFSGMRMVPIKMQSGSARRKGGAEQEQTWQSLVQLSRQCIEPRLLESMIERLRGGAEVTIDRITLTSQGISRKGALGKVSWLSWGGLGGTDVFNGEVRVYAKKAKEGKKSHWITLRLEDRNVVLLLPLLESAQLLFER